MTRTLFLTIMVGTLAASASMPYRPEMPNSNVPLADPELAIGAPDVLNPVLSEMAREFEQKTGDHVHFVTVDSPGLDSQIRKGPPLDALFLTNAKDAQRLAAQGMVVRASITEYARDRLVLCISPVVRVEPRPGSPLLLLRDKTIPHVAIGDPQHSAFGKDTVQALRSVRAYDTSVRRKLLLGENMAEVASLLRTGTAEMAVLPESAVAAYQLQDARVILISTNPSIRMVAAVVARSKHPREARAFLKFAASPTGKTVFHQYGFFVPSYAAVGKR